MTKIVDFEARVREKLRQQERHPDRFARVWERQKALVAPIQKMRDSGHTDLEIAHTLHFIADVLEGKDG
jgi:hypothetical protein